MNNLAKAITGKWWLVTLRGVLAVLFGVAAWVWPNITVFTLVLLFGSYAVIGGVASLAAARGQRRQGHSLWPSILQGVLGIGTGIVVMLWPGVSALALMYVIAGWAFVTGLFEVIGAIELRKTIEHEWRLALAGIGSIAFGVFAALYPGAGAVALVWTIGVYAIAFGFLLVALGFRLHGRGRHLATATA